MFAILFILIQASNQVMLSKTLIGRNFNKTDSKSKQAIVRLLASWISNVQICKDEWECQSINV